MDIRIIAAEMKTSPEDGYIGNVRFAVEGHPKDYEMTLYSKKGKDWEYGLHFAEESGSDDLIEAVEAYLEENDEAFDAIVDAAYASMTNKP